MHYRVISNTVTHIGSFVMRENQYSKAKGWIDFSYVECFRSENLSIWFLEEHKVCVNILNVEK